MENCVKKYETDELEVFWKPDICQHSGKCTGTLPSVFDISKKPRIELSKATTKDITNTIDICPSGALSYRLKNK